ncbi:MAG TPA: hypothetical protein VIY51_08715 [Xanthobacteraceae bacterium]
MKAAVNASFAVGFLIAALVDASASPARAAPEDRYVASREAAIKKLKLIYDGGDNDAGTKAEDAALAALEAQMRAILGPLHYSGFGPAKLNLDSLSAGDEGFGMLDGLRFDADIGKNGEPAGKQDTDGKYVEPRAHIIVTTQTLFARWLRAHKHWWDKGLKNVPQQIGAALKDESFYTQAISTDSAVVSFGGLPIAKPASAVLAYAMLAGRTQSEVPDAADEVFVAAIAADRVYVAYGSIEPKMQIPACDAIWADYNKRSEEADEALREKRINKKTYDKLGNLRDQGEAAFKRCFIARAPKQPAFADATKQAQALLEKAVGK